MTDRIAGALARGRRRPLVVPFLTAGYPELSSTVPAIRAMARAGADVIEVGMPFSDPLADGPTIQRASERALANGMTVPRALDAVRLARETEEVADVPILLMGYCNPLFRYGTERFVRDARDAGVDGLIIPDLPPEEASSMRAACVEAGMGMVFLMAPNASDDRIRRVDELSTHFSYCVSITGVTGARGEVEDRTLEFLGRVARLATKPFVVGFGVRTPEHVRRLGCYAAGVVVGSALIDGIDAAPDPFDAIEETVKSLRAAADATPREAPGAGR
jgi:tryptophan synthase alpha chain